MLQLGTTCSGGLISGGISRAATTAGCKKTGHWANLYMPTRTLSRTLIAFLTMRHFRIHLSLVVLLPSIFPVLKLLSYAAWQKHGAKEQKQGQRGLDDCRALILGLCSAGSNPVNLAKVWLPPRLRVGTTPSEDPERFGLDKAIMKTIVCFKPDDTRFKFIAQDGKRKHTEEHKTVDRCTIDGTTKLERHGNRAFLGNKKQRPTGREG